jgi:hypothetical protein
MRFMDVLGKEPFSRRLAWPLLRGYIYTVVVVNRHKRTLGARTKNKRLGHFASCLMVLALRPHDCKQNTNERYYDD